MSTPAPRTTQHPRRPFSGVTGEGWQNLALVTAAALYLLLFGLQIATHATCAKLAADYCSFWSAGHIANQQGYGEVYDLDEMERVQREIFPSAVNPGQFATIPTPYFPAFILPFQLFALLPPAAGYWLWTALNLGALAGYLLFLARRATGRPLERRLLALSLLSWPVFLNLYSGQINVILTICVGEFLRAAMSGKPNRAGLWLGGLLLKPQFLVLIGLALLMQRSWRMLAGLAAASAAIAGLSALLLGPRGIAQFAQLWALYARGQQETLAIGVMMNWRMIEIRLDQVFTPARGWPVAILGMGLTLIAVIYLWRKRIDPASPAFVIALVGTLAATGLFAWHSHLTSAIYLLGPFIYLSQPEPRLPKTLFAAWALLPMGLYLVALAVGPLLAGLLPAVAARLPAFLFSGIFLSALGVFGLNIYLLVWSLGQSRSAQPVAPAPVLPEGSI